MSIIECKCPNCGAPVKVNPSEEASYCEYCGKAFITEKAINVNGDYINNQTVIKEDNEYTVELEKERNRIKALENISKSNEKFEKRAVIYFIVLMGFLLLMSLLGIE